MKTEPTLKELKLEQTKLRFLIENKTEVVSDYWLPAKPIGRRPLLVRLKEALLILQGKATAIRWY